MPQFIHTWPHLTGQVLVLFPDYIVKTEVQGGEMTRSWCVALWGQGLLLLPSPGGCSSGQPASQTMAAFHGLDRPQLRAWFLFGEPGQKSSQGPDGVL